MGRSFLDQKRGCLARQQRQALIGVFIDLWVKGGFLVEKSRFLWKMWVSGVYG